jgi:Flp pilus assembly protein TadB
VIVIVAWVIAPLIGVVVLGFCAYELTWKAQRLRRDTLRLQELVHSLQQMQRELTAVRQRVADVCRP